MKGIIIAAGPSTRLRPITENLPKCLLKINGKSLIQNIMDLFRENGVNDLSVIKGYRKETINFPNVTYFENNDFWNNNILHSLMHARAKLEEAVKTKEDVVISYADIWYTDMVVKTLLESKQSITAVVDLDWKKYYEGRTDHPISQAESVIMDENKQILKIGKHILTDDIPREKQGEFIGLWKFSPEGIGIFLKHFDRLNSSLKKLDKFQNAKEWQKAYITDIFQEIIDKGGKIYCATISENWKEIDTVQDFERAKMEKP